MRSGTSLERAQRRRPVWLFQDGGTHRRSRDSIVCRPGQRRAVTRAPCPCTCVLSRLCACFALRGRLSHREPRNHRRCRDARMWRLAVSPQRRAARRRSALRPGVASRAPAGGGPCACHCHAERPVRAQPAIVALRVLLRRALRPWPGHHPSPRSLFEQPAPGSELAKHAFQVVAVHREGFAEVVPPCKDIGSTAKYGACTWERRSDALEEFLRVRAGG